MKAMQAIAKILFLLSSLWAAQSSGFSVFDDHTLTDFGRQHEAADARTIDHTPWSALLRQHIRPMDGINYFDYGNFDAQDQARLADYIDMLADIAVTGLNRDEQFAYWVNLYNALTIAVVMEHYPVTSIRDISFSLLSWGPWKEPLVSVAGRELSLDDIEHRILRPVFKDPRIHYVVNCASIGCPNLGTEALTAATIEPALEAAARQFINHPRAVSIRRGQLVLSSIYDWYADDFGANDAELIAHLQHYADPELAAGLATIAEIDDFGYDWSLNGLPDAE